MGEDTLRLIYVLSEKDIDYLHVLLSENKQTSLRDNNDRAMILKTLIDESTCYLQLHTVMAYVLSNDYTLRPVGSRASQIEIINSITSIDDSVQVGYDYFANNTGLREACKRFLHQIIHTSDIASASQWALQYRFCNGVSVSIQGIYYTEEFL